MKISKEAFLNKISNKNELLEVSAEDFADLFALEYLVDRFACELKRKVKKKFLEGNKNWDLTSSAFLLDTLKKHIKKGDMSDVGIIAMFLWNKGMDHNIKSNDGTKTLREFVSTGRRNTTT